MKGKEKIKDKEVDAFSIKLKLPEGGGNLKGEGGRNLEQ